MSEKARIVVGGLESKNGIHSIVSVDGKRYGFFETDQSKMYETPQYIQFRKVSPKAGDTLDIEFTPRMYINKFGKSVQAFNLDTLEKLTGPAAREAVEEADSKAIRNTIELRASIYLSSRLQGGANFEEVEQEVGKAVALAVKVTDVVGDLFGDGEESRTLETGYDHSAPQLGADGKPIPF